MSELTNLYTAVKEALVATALLDGVGGDFVNPGADLERLQARLRELGYTFQAHKLMALGGQHQYYATIWLPEDKSPWTDHEVTICKISSISAESAFLDAVYDLIHNNHFKSHRITR